MDTSERIKLAAQRLFSQVGIEGVTVRDIVAAAALKNPGSLNYYFRSKEELIRQVICDAMGDANALWGARLAKIEASGGPTSLREVVSALVAWPLSNSPDGSVPHTARFLAMVLQTRTQMLRALTREMHYNEYDRALCHMRGFLTALPPDVVNQRVVFFFWSMTGFLAAYEAFADSDSQGDSIWDRTDPFENFVDSMVGMLGAPTCNPAPSLPAKINTAKHKTSAAVLRKAGRRPQPVKTR
ncbi:TetR/AcrR family transcriptional regulator [Paraburkholderia sp. USG1]|uniref:TetR/AcrR family transcriptional regulator n=1 Tax=Paraburkholderia sp. USG1 TaxID=2952268 RepID=UPI0028611E4C|nr:helix-turn-helix domain-containing protein [Paraburkholderia sp. USG1]MDR8398375.1 TetR/AcrR family transcriptional regulator [Paraburkholderia sp. USG1]